MTPEQYGRWNDFARRMVIVAVAEDAKEPSRDETLDIVEAVFDELDFDEQWRWIKDWDSTEADENGRHSICVGDLMSELEDGYVPGYWSLGDDEFEGVRDQWMGPARCCVRAGLDVAVAPSGGVIGFTAGDIRAMYADGVPQWVKDFFDAVDGELVALHPTNIEGIFHPEKVPDNRKFDDLPDDQGVWL